MNTLQPTYTPGPWVSCHGDARRKFNIECKRAGNDDHPIATCKGPDREANARLIAAAPDLLAALQSLVTPLAKGWKVTDMETRIAEAQAAIDKATRPA